MTASTSGENKIIMDANFFVSPNKCPLKNDEVLVSVFIPFSDKVIVVSGNNCF